MPTLRRPCPGCNADPLSRPSRRGPTMTSALLALRIQRAAQRLGERLMLLEERLHDDPAIWSEYCAVATALAQILPNIAPGRQGELLTTKEMAARLSVSPKTLLKRWKTGELRPAVVLGKRGRAAMRWNGSEVPR